MTELQNLQIVASKYYGTEPDRRTENDRIEYLANLGIENPKHFLASVWSPQWGDAIDQVFNPNCSRLRPLPRSDAYFPWAVGAINLLPLPTRKNIIGLKMKPAGLEAAIKELLARAGYKDTTFTLEDVTVLDQIHTEYGLTIRTSDSKRVQVEISHYLPMAEEIFHRFSDAFEIPALKVHTGRSNMGGNYIVEMHHPDSVELDKTSHDQLSAFGDKIISRAGLHDAFGDILGTIMRDSHYLLSRDGELYTYHHYQLFVEMDEDHFGFFRPVFNLLGDELGGEAEWFTKYQKAYIESFNAIQNRRHELLSILNDAEPAIAEFLDKDGTFAEVKAAVEKRLQFDPAKRVDTIGQLFLAS